MVEVMGVGKLINSFSFSDLKAIPAKVNLFICYEGFFAMIAVPDSQRYPWNLDVINMKILSIRK